MGFLIHIFLAIGVFVLGCADVTQGVVWPWAAPIFLAMPYALVFAARRAAFSRRGLFAMAAARLSTFAGPVSYLALMWTTGWIQAVRGWTGADLGWTSWPEPAAALAFAPYVVLQFLALDAEARAVHPPGAPARNWRSFQARMFLSALVPPGLFYVAVIAVGTNDALRAHVEHVQLLGFLFLGLLLVLLGLNLPSLLRGTWETVPLPPGYARELFDDVAARADFQAREVLLWRTGNLMANAAIVGLTPGRRVVLLSDSLLASLEPRALAAVYGHEIAHSKRHHVPIFLAWTLAFLGMSLVAVEWLGNAGTWGEAAIVGGALVTWALVFGWLSRRFELEADLFAVELLGEPGGMVRALETVGGRLRDVAGWRHFSTSRRVDFLLRATADPVFRRGFKRRVRFFGRLGVALGVLTMVTYLVQLARAWPEDKLVTDLALGNYASAATRAAELPGIDDELRALVARAATVGADEGVAELTTRFEAAFDARDWVRARDWAELLALRGEVAYDWAAYELTRALEEGRAPELELVEAPGPSAGR